MIASVGRALYSEGPAWRQTVRFHPPGPFECPALVRARAASGEGSSSASCSCAGWWRMVARDGERNERAGGPGIARRALGEWGLGSARGGGCGRMRVSRTGEYGRSAPSGSPRHGTRAAPRRWSRCSECEVCERGRRCHGGRSEVEGAEVTARVVSMLQD